MMVLSELVAALRSGEIRVIDLTQPLGPETPVIGLPDMFGASKWVPVCSPSSRTLQAQAGPRSS